MTGPIERARAAFARRSWAEAFEILSTARPEAADDLERLAVTAYLTGHDDDSVEAWDRAHRAWLDRGDVDRAALCVAWLALCLVLRGETAHASGWQARAERLTGDRDECAARGLLLVVPFLERIGADPAGALAVATEMTEIGRRCRDADVVAIGLLSCGEACVAAGDLERGVRLLDEAMIGVAAGDVAPIPAGIVYCAVIEACMEMFDLRRAAEWTRSLHRWCEAQPDMVPYRGQCLVHRSQVLQAGGAWDDAVVEAERAQARLTEPRHPALGLALYQRAELHRLRGEFGAADEGYRNANHHGYQPTPGIALLRLAEGDADAAVAIVRRSLDEQTPSTTRAAALVAAVEIMLSTGDAASAALASDELTELAERIATPLLRARAAYSAGAVRLSEGLPAEALRELRTAGDLFRELDVPYEVARSRVLVALACRALADDATADIELEAAATVFAELGALPDVERVAAMARRAGTRPGGLTVRECDVLRLVATGRTNREVASALSISEHTVARHLQNIFLKLDLPSRSAATAFAIRHGVV